MLEINLNFPLKSISGAEIKEKIKVGAEIKDGNIIYAHHTLADQFGTKGPEDFISTQSDEIARQLYKTGLLIIRNSEKDKVVNYIEKETNLFTTVKAQIINAIKEAKEEKKEAKEQDATQD